ncbi:MAG: hypothetical protein ACI8PZ_002999 [Myxococcota bacterium]|jgi:hypothetical protein
MGYCDRMTVLLLTLAALAADLDISGDCPGEMTLRVGLTPGAEAALLTASAVGDSEIWGGACGGTALDLDADGLTVRIRQVDEDGDGEVVVRPVLSDGACGLPVQAVDLATCAVSTVAILGPPPPPPVLVAAEGQRDGDGFWAVDTATGEVWFLGSNGHRYTSLAADDNGVLHGLTGRTDTGIAELHKLGADLTSEVLADVEALSAAGLSFESGLAWMSGTSRWCLVDQDGQILVLERGGEVVHDLAFGTFGVGYGRDLVSDDGNRLWFINHAELWSVTSEARSFLAAVTGVPHGADRNGGAASWHDGQLWLAESDGEQTWLFTVDTVTGVAVDSGLRIPDPHIDALASQRL